MATTNVHTEIVTPFLEVREKPETSYKSLFARQEIAADFLLSVFTYQEKLTHPDRYSVQLTETSHITLAPNYLKYTNHNCNPNVFFDTVNMKLITLRPIQKGEEITFFYPSTEWKMTEPFNCICNSPNCLGEIRGGAFLTYDNLVKYRLSEYILDKYRNL